MWMWFSQYRTFVCSWFMVFMKCWLSKLMNEQIYKKSCVFKRNGLQIFSAYIWTTVCWASLHAILILMGLKPFYWRIISFTSSQDCFKVSWSSHKSVHSKSISSSAPVNPGEQNAASQNDGWLYCLRKGNARSHELPHFDWSGYYFSSYLVGLPSCPSIL